MQVYQLDNGDLNYWVAQSLELRVVPLGDGWAMEASPSTLWSPRSDWRIGGPILHEQKVSVIYVKNAEGCKAECHIYRSRERPPHRVGRQWGDDPLQAGLRALVHAVHGEEVESPLQHFENLL
ncbi:DUF2591 family protein [Variovorax paradoxus]|nr:DUF2591 family protein [Variovorax paradoxus]